MSRKMIMFTKVTLVVFAIVLALSGMGSAGEVSIEKARTVAQNFLQYTIQAYGPWAGTDSPSISNEEVVMYEDQVVGYNFLVDPKGHILVSSRDDLPPVKLYSDTSTLSIYAEETQEQVDWIAEETFDIGQAIDEHSMELDTMDASQNPDVQAWALLGNSSFGQEYESLAEEAEFLQYGPLLSTAWDQPDPYNRQCPLYFTGCRTLVGCVATAAAQIMKYWNYPATGTGSTSYSWWNGSYYQTLSRNFAASTYDWANMPNSISSSSSSTQINAVAKLSADVGIAFHMNYGCSASGGSGANTSDAPMVFRTYFGYKSTVTWVDRSSYGSQSAWMQVFRTETANGRPSQLRLRDPARGGHSVVIDGYRSSPEAIHLNMGWSGNYNGWYTPDSFTTGSFNWTQTYYQGAAIRIEPPVAVVKRDEIIGTWNDGIRYYNFATGTWTKMNPYFTSGDIAAGDFTGDGRADVAVNWPSGLYYHNGASPYAYTWLSDYPCNRVTAGDVTGDGRTELIGTWDSAFRGIYYGNFVTKSWTQMWPNVPSGDIAAGDFTGDGKADVAANWSTGLWYQNGVTRAWTKVSDIACNNLTVGDVTGDGRVELIGSWSGVYNGIHYGNFVTKSWTQITSDVPSGDIAAGEFTGDNKDDVCATFSSGLRCYKAYIPNTGPWSPFWSYSKFPNRLTAGDVTGD